MMRRSRFSVRPNVSIAGRTSASTPQETPTTGQAATENPKEADESNSTTTVTGNTDVTPSEKAPCPGNGNDQNGDSTSSSAALQRRKRFSVKPKVAPGRPSTSRTPKSPIKVVSETTAEVTGSDSDKPSTSSQAGTTAAPPELQSPRRQRHSEDSKQTKIQTKLTPTSYENSSSVESAESLLKQTDQPTDGSKQTENLSGGKVKEVSLRPPDKVPPSLPDREATEISEKAKTLVSSKSLVSLTPSALSLSRLLNSPSDLQRLVKAQKLRELLRQERWKEKKLKRAKACSKEFTLDPTKMTMRDLIHYLPTSNPMTSSLEETALENETEVHFSPERMRSPERAQEPETRNPIKVSSRQEEVQEEVQEEEQEEEVAADGEEEDEEALMVPQVKVAEDGSLIIDEESLTVEVLRAKGPNPAQDRDPIFERGSTTTYSSFRKATYTKPWSIEETDMFFLAVSMVGTDFSMICQLFPHRARSEIKNKFKKEERVNSWRVDKAFRERRKLDIEYFSKLLEKVLEVQKDKKKLRSLAQKNTSKRNKNKAKGKNLSDAEKEDENQIPDLEGGEKENDDLSNEGGIPAPEPKRKRKRKNKSDALIEEPSDKKNKKDPKSNKQSEAEVPEDSEAALPEDHTNPDIFEKTQNVNATTDSAVQPAKLSGRRAAKSVLPLGLNPGKKRQPSTKATEGVPGKEGQSGNEDDSSLGKVSRRNSVGDDITSEEEDITVKPQKPTRYGRVPKPTHPLNYSSEDDPPSASETTSASPVASKSKTKTIGKRGNSSKSQSALKSKKPKLVTLRSSKSDFSGDEDEDGQTDNLLTYSSSKESGSSLFVPTSLHTSNPEISEVDESMVELDILDSMPDVLGISQDAMCLDSSCQQAQDETGTTEPCEHQLDLLVDVIDLLSSEHTEEAQDESYNEAAQTLLTIGNLAHISQSEEIETLVQDSLTADGDEPRQLEEGPPDQIAIPSVSAELTQKATETSETVTSVELESSEADSGDTFGVKSNDPMSDKLIGETEPTTHLQSNPENPNESSPLTKPGLFPKVKPKPNLSRTPRTAQSVSETSKEREAEEESPAVSLNLSQTNETEKISESAPELFKDDISTTKMLADQEESDVITTDCGSLTIQSDCYPESQPELTTFTKSASESTDETLSADVRTQKTVSDKHAASESSVMETVEDSCSNSAPVQDESEKLPPSSVEDLPVSQKEKSKDLTLCKPGRSRLPKVKPKPNLPRALKCSRSKPQTTEGNPVEDLHSCPNPELEPASTRSPICNPKEVQPPNEEMNTHVGFVDQALDVASSDQTVREGQNYSEVQLEPKIDETIRDTVSASTFIDRNLMSKAGTSGSNTDVLPHSVVTEPEIRAGPHVKGATAEEGGGSPTLVIAPEEKLAATEEKGKLPSACHLRKTRSQKMKPKPNLPLTSRAEKSKPQATKEQVEKDSSAHPEFQKTTVAEAEPTPACTALPEKQSESAHPSSAVKPSILTIEELPLKEETQTSTGIFVQVEHKQAAASDQNTMRNQTCSEVLLESCKEETTRCSGSADQNLIPHAGTDERSFNNEGRGEEQTRSGGVCQMEVDRATSNPNVSEKPGREDPPSDKVSVSDIGHETVTSHEVISESCGELAATDLQVGQGLNVDSATTEEDRGNPALIVKPVEKIQVHQEHTEASAACQLRKGRLPKIKPKPQLRQTRAARPKSQTIKEPDEKDSSFHPNPEFGKKIVAVVEQQPECNPSPEIQSQSTNEGLIGKINVVATDQSAKEVQPALTDGPVSTELPDENLMTTVGTESTLNNVRTTNSALTESQVGHGSNVSLAPVQERNDQPAAPATFSDPLPASKKDDAVAPTSQSGRSGSLKPEPRSEPELKKGSITLLQLVDIPQSSVEEAETEPTCSAAPPERSRQNKSSDLASDPDPSLDLASTRTRSKGLLKAEEQLIKDAGCEQVLSPTCSKQAIPQRRQRFPKGKPKPNLGSPSRIAIRKPKPEAHNTLSEEQPMETSDGTTDGTVEKSSGDLMSINPPSETDHSSLRDYKVDRTSTKTVTASTNQLTTDPAAASDLKVSIQVGSTEAETHSVSAADTSPVHAEKDCSVQDTDHTADPFETSIKAPQKSRGRPLRPKPNLKCSTRPPQRPPVQNITPSGADSGSCSQVEEASIDEKTVIDNETAERFIDKPSNSDFSSNNAPSSPGCVAQLSPILNAPMSSTEESQRYSLLSEVLPEKVPSDPEEPFFILSLTEIPVCSSGEVLDTRAEHLPSQPVSDASIQHPSVSGESSASGHGPLPYATKPVSTKESMVTSVIDKQDIGSEPAASEGSRSDVCLQEDTANPQEALESSGAEILPSKQRPIDSARKDTLRRRKKPATSAPIEAEEVPNPKSSSQDCEHPEPPAQPKAFDERSDQEKPAGGKNPDSRSESKPAQSAECKKRRNAKAVSKRAKMKSPFKTGKKPSELADSASHDVAPTQSVTQPPKESHSAALTSPAPLEVDISPTSDCFHPTPRTSHHKAEASASQEGDCVESFFVEEPTNVSQYFLSDIFTEVDEG
ncbi:unnamed protein product [Menidia menidia]|uniref:(Atlantic silverside) hypothetical protein n=1 Tax=Menidia menidia TaxID=238744 RepID=A0A8S4AHZ0_9TELE|nr:unnamed protein product [Menidia menidia]